MIILPPFDDFAQAYGRGHAQVVSTKLVSDLETPVSVMLKLARNSAYGFLLESVEGGAVRGRYSMIGLKPDLIWRVEGARPEINRKPLAGAEGPFEPLEKEPLASLRDLDARFRDEVAQGGQRLLLKRLERAFRVGQRLAVDLGPRPFDAPDEVGLEADHRVAAAHRAAFHRLQQEAVGRIAGKLQHDRHRRLEVGHELGRDHLGVAPAIGLSEVVERRQDDHRLPDMSSLERDGVGPHRQSGPVRLTYRDHALDAAGGHPLPQLLVELDLEVRLQGRGIL